MSKETNSPRVETARPRQRAWAALLPAAVIVVAGLVAYHNSFRGPFVFDDTDSITDNLTIRSLRSIRQVLSPPAEGETVTGRPLINLSLAVNYAISRFEVWSYHVFNLVVHILAGLTLYAVVRCTLLLPKLQDRFGPAATFLALAVALIWTVHPLQTESVTYVVQRAESIVALLYVLTLYCVIRGAASTKAVAWHVLAVLACLLGMASKEVMVSAPLIVLLYDRTFLAGSFRQALRRRWGLYLALAATWALLAILMIQSPKRGGTAGLGIGPSPWLYMLNQFRWIVHYLRLSFWPNPVVLDYGDNLLWRIPQVWPHAIIVLGLLAATVGAMWRQPKLGFMGAWFFAVLAPTSSVIPIAQVAAEHRMYLALAAVVGLSVMAAYGLWERLAPRLSRLRSRYLRRLLPATALTIIAAALVLRTVMRNRDYRSDLAIWEAAVNDWPINARAYNNVGLALDDQGRSDEAGEYVRQAIRLAPRYATAHSNLGMILAKQGKPDDAIEHIKKALEIQPNLAQAHNNMGLVLQGQGKLDQAQCHFQRALEIRPAYAEAHNNLGLLYSESSRLNEAIYHYQQAVRIRPNLAEAYNNLGLAFAQLNMLDQAIEAYQQALQFKPDLPEPRYNLLSAFTRVKELDKAIERYKEASRLSPDDPETHFGLARLLEARGRIDQAVEQYQQALNLARALGQARLASEIQARLELYQAGKVPPQSPPPPVVPWR